MKWFAFEVRGETKAMWSVVGVALRPPLASDKPPFQTKYTLEYTEGFLKFHTFLSRCIIIIVGRGSRRWYFISVPIWGKNEPI